MTNNNTTNTSGNRIVSIIFSVILILFASLAAHKLPKSITKYLENIWFRFFIFCAIAYLATKDLIASIIATIAVMISYQSLAIHKITDQVMEKTNKLLKTSTNVPGPYDNAATIHNDLSSVNTIPIINSVSSKLSNTIPIDNNVIPVTSVPKIVNSVPIMVNSTANTVIPSNINVADTHGNFDSQNVSVHTIGSAPPVLFSKPAVTNNIVPSNVTDTHGNFDSQNVSVHTTASVPLTLSNNIVHTTASVPLNNIVPSNVTDTHDNFNSQNVSVHTDSLPHLSSASMVTNNILPVNIVSHDNHVSEIPVLNASSQVPPVDSKTKQNMEEVITEQIMSYTKKILTSKPETDVNFIINTISLEVPELNREFIESVVKYTIHRNKLHNENLIKNNTTNKFTASTKYSGERNHTKKLLQGSGKIPAYNDEKDSMYNEYITKDNHVLTDTCAKNYSNMYNCDTIPHTYNNLFNGIPTDFDNTAAY